MSAADANLLFRAVSYPVGHIHGVVATAMVQFAPVMLDSSVEDPNTLIAANDISRAYFLDRETILNNQAGQDRILREQVFGNELTPPYLVGQQVTAVKYEWIQVEGSDLVDASLTAATAAETPVCFKAGKIADQTANNTLAIAGYVRRVLTALDAGSDGRFHIQFAL